MLLRFGPDAPRLDHEWVRSLRIGTDILDARGLIRRAYDVKDDGAVLIRPDGYIGAVTTQPAALAAFASRVLPDQGSAHRDRKGGVAARVAQ